VPEIDRARGWGTHHYTATTNDALDMQRYQYIDSKCVPGGADLRHVGGRLYQTFQDTLNPDDPVYT
jgi:hypothetical protein